MLTRNSFLDSFDKCLLCGVTHSQINKCTCHNYAGDAEILTISLSANGYCLHDLYKHMLWSKDRHKLFESRLEYTAFFDPYLAAADFIIKTGKKYKDYKSIALYAKMPNGYQGEVHYAILPVLLRFIRDMTKNGGPKAYFIKESGAKMLQAIVDLTLVLDHKNFEDISKSIMNSNYLVYNVSLHLRGIIYSQTNIYVSDNIFKNAFVEIIPQVTCKDFSLPKNDAESIADLFCFTRGLLKGKKPLRSESLKLLESYFKNYNYYNVKGETNFNPKTRDTAEFAVLAGI